MYEMYRIREVKIKIKTPCLSCAGKGYIDKKCTKCGGNGLHNKTINMWVVYSKKIQIEKIDRGSQDSIYKGILLTRKGELRYWEDSSCYVNEDSKLLHFTKEDAIRECEERNLEKYGEEFYSQYLKGEVK